MEPWTSWFKSSVFHAEDRGFESRRLYYQIALKANWLRYLSFEQVIAGSNPVGVTIRH